MIFNKNQVDFPTPRHKAIWDEGRQIVPLEVSLADISDLEMREGCTQIYDWTMEYFENIYNNSEHYSGYKPSGMFHLLDDIAEFATVTNNGLIFTQKKYNQLLRLRQDYLPDLQLVGLNILDKSEYRILINTKYPLFCKYFKLFYDAAFKKKVNRKEYLFYNDFRVLAPKYKRTFDDLLRVLPDNLKEYASELHEYVLNKGAKLESPRYYCYFRYKYKKENLLILHKNSHRNTPLDIAVPYGPDFENFMQVVELQSDREELIAYIQKESCKCDACNGTKKVAERCCMWKDIHGVKLLLSSCHKDISKWTASKSNLDYTDYDIKILKRIIDIRFSLIDNSK